MSMTMELKCCPFCGGEAESDSLRGYRNISTGNPENAAAIYCTKCSADMTWCYRDTPEIERDHVMKLLIEQWNTRATASLQGEDAVERVARIKSLLVSFHRNSCYPEAMTGELNDAAERILATGLVPDEAAVRADEREKCAQEAFTAVTHVVIPDDGNTTLADHVAAAIRAGGAK